MDGKVMASIFGLIILLAAVFLFFKSFASHEQRMQAEQQARLEEEQRKLLDVKGGLPLTPEEKEARLRLMEARKKADEARLAAAQAARREAEKQALAQQAELQKRQAEELKKQAEAQQQQLELQRQAEELRLKQAEEAKKQAEEELKQASEREQARLAAEKDRQTADLNRQKGEVLASMQEWAETVITDSAKTYGVGVSQRPRTIVRVYNSSNPTGVVVVPEEYITPDEDPSFANWGSYTLKEFCTKALANDAGRPEPEVKLPELFQLLDQIDDQDGLKDLHINLSREMHRSRVVDAEAQQRQSASRSLLSTALMQLKKPNTEENRAERAQAVDRLRSQIVEYWRAMNEARGARAAGKMLSRARDRTADRLKELGVVVNEQPGGNATAAGGAAAPETYKIYAMKDGSELKAYMVVKMGDSLAIKDEKGEMHTVKSSEVKEIRKP